MLKQQKIRFPIYQGGHFVCPFLNSNGGEKYIHHITSTGLCKLHVISKLWSNNIDLDENIIGDDDKICDDFGCIEYYNYDIEFNGRLNFNDRIYDGDELIIYNKSDRHIFIEIEYDIDEGYDEDISYKNNTIKDIKGFEFYEEETIPYIEIKKVVLDKKFKLVKFPKCKILSIDVRFDPLMKGKWWFSIKEQGDSNHTIYEEKLKASKAYKEIDYNTDGLIAISNMSVCDDNSGVIPMFIYFNIELKNGSWFQYPY